jgi:glycosyltransferase involved in cell wall biosynthesis
MKILTIVYNLEKGGTQRAAQNFCEGYGELGHDSKILAAYGSGVRAGELQQKGIKVWFGLDASILNEIAHWSPDLVHIHSHVMNDHDIYNIKKTIPNAKFVETNVFSIPSGYENILEYSYQLSSWCHFLYLAKGGSKGKSTIVPYPIKSEAFFKSKKWKQLAFREKYGIPKDAFVFGRIGQDNLSKWSLYLVDLFDKFCSEIDENSYLLIVNPPHEIIKYIYNKKLKHIVIIDKLIGDEELRDCYSSIDLFLHIANIGESFGMVLAESILCETPVITLSTPWADNSQCEVMGYGIGGLCASTLNQYYLFMVELFNDKNKLNKLGTNGRKHILNKYDYLLVAQRSLDIINHTHPIESIRFDFSSIQNTNIHIKQLSFVLLKAKLKIIYLNRPINFMLRIIAGFNTIKGKKLRNIFK